MSCVEECTMYSDSEEERRIFAPLEPATSRVDPPEDKVPSGFF